MLADSSVLTAANLGFSRDSGKQIALRSRMASGEANLNVQFVPP
jgi:hypothetical protein